MFRSSNFASFQIQFSDQFLPPPPLLLTNGGFPQPHLCIFFAELLFQFSFRFQPFHGPPPMSLQYSLLFAKMAQNKTYSVQTQTLEKKTITTATKEMVCLLICLFLHWLLRKLQNSLAVLEKLLSSCPNCSK